MAFAKRILESGGAGPYLGFLKSGSSDYPITILQKAGVDMSTPEPVREALTLFGTLLDDLEKRM
jgi:oligoendopeptidase F